MKLGIVYRTIGHAIALLLCISVIVPLGVALGTAFKPANEVFSLIPWPQNPTFRNFRYLFEATPFGQYLWNSVATTFLRVVGQIVIAVGCAYAFARWEFKGKEFVFAVVLGAMMIPHTLTMIPIYIMVAQLNWFDSWAGLIIPNLAMPFAVFLLRQHFKSFPKELFEAAEIDGAGHFRTLWSIVLPSMKPALATLSIILSIECWNEYFWPLLVTSEPSARTVQIGIRVFVDQDYADYGAMMAGVVTSTLPILVLFIFFQRQIMATFVSSGLKG